MWNCPPVKCGSRRSSHHRGEGEGFVKPTFKGSSVCYNLRWGIDLLIMQSLLHLWGKHPALPSKDNETCRREKKPWAEIVMCALKAWRDINNYIARLPVRGQGWTTKGCRQGLKWINVTISNNNNMLQVARLTTLKHITAWYLEKPVQSATMYCTSTYWVPTDYKHS